MDRKGGQGVALIRQEVAEEKGRRPLLQYNTNTYEMKAASDLKERFKLHVTQMKMGRWQLNNE